MSPAKVNVLGLTQKSPLETIWRMAESRPTIFAGARAWIPGCRYRTCSKLSPLSRCQAHAAAIKVMQWPDFRMLLRPGWTLVQGPLGCRFRLAGNDRHRSSHDTRSWNCFRAYILDWHDHSRDSCEAHRIDHAPKDQLNLFHPHAQRSVDRRHECVCNPDRSPVGINGRDVTVAPPAFLEIVSDFKRLMVNMANSRKPPAFSVTNG